MYPKQLAATRNPTVSIGISPTYDTAQQNIQATSGFSGAMQFSTSVPTLSTDNFVVAVFATQVGSGTPNWNATYGAANTPMTFYNSVNYGTTYQLPQ